MRNVIGRFLGVSIVALLLSSCSTEISADGKTYVIGLVNILDTKPTVASPPHTGLSTAVTSFGLTIYRTPYDLGVFLGYGENEVVALTENACVLRPVEAQRPAKRAI